MKWIVYRKLKENEKVQLVEPFRFFLILYWIIKTYNNGRKSISSDVVYKSYYWKSGYWFVVLQKNENQDSIGLMILNFMIFQSQTLLKFKVELFKVDSIIYNNVEEYNNSIGYLIIRFNSFRFLVWLSYWNN